MAMTILDTLAGRFDETDRLISVLWRRVDKFRELANREARDWARIAASAWSFCGLASETNLQMSGRKSRPQQRQGFADALQAFVDASSQAVRVMPLSVPEDQRKKL